MQCDPLSEQGGLMGLYQASTFTTYLTLSLVICLVVFVQCILFIYFQFKRSNW